MSTKLKSMLKLSSKIAALNKTNSHNLNKFQSKVHSTFKLDTPGIILKGWFKYIEITPSKESQDFEINPEF